MHDHYILQEVMELDAKVKAIWPSGWASICCGHGNWAALIYDDNIKCHPHNADNARDALALAGKWLSQNQPMTTARLASILGIELAA